ncbi:indole-3-glycerol phosphate synthase TrpC [Texcoconibacillus texcoconensis]|uniref:indole-3-glycerol phosphate synthase TrpC n=1 Tax=Texcoconibacillus texcoconensis TaxID=1095777 RepID=UPI00161FC964
MLDDIVATKKQEMKQFAMPLESEVKGYSFFEALREPHRSLGVIAEVKAASPSKGVIKEQFSALDVARSYQEAGADALSVLTDESYFKGSCQRLTEVKKHVNLPVIRKDFIIDERQIEESKRIGADAILLIASILEPKTLKSFYEQAKILGLDCLVEVHGYDELQKVLDQFEPDILGVNNRDLKTFTTSLQETENLARHIPKSSIFVSESGIHEKADIDFVSRCGANAVLVGEALMRADDPRKTLPEWFAS